MKILFFFLASFIFIGNASGEAHLKFHMAFGSGAQTYIGGTIGNSGSQAIRHGAVGFITLSERCEVTGVYSTLYGPVAPGADVQFRLPVDAAGMSRYRLIFFQAYDSDGFPLKTADDTENIIRARESEDRAKCKN